MNTNVCYVGDRKCNIRVNERTDDMSATEFTRAIRNGEDISKYIPHEMTAVQIDQLNAVFDRVGRKNIFGKKDDYPF
jgi:hypothetical protein